MSTSEKPERLELPQPVFELARDLLARFADTSTDPPTQVHDPRDCADHDCVLHRPSAHHMRDWRIVWRPSKRWLAERMCPHGIGHPDPDDMAYRLRVDPENGWAWGVHGCDGCCQPGQEKDRR